jgi:hypothetical protein
MGRLDCPIDRQQQLVADCVQIDRVAQAHGECRDDRFGVIAGAVEAAVDDPLHPLSQRVEQGGCAKGGGGDADR